MPNMKPLMQLLNETISIQSNDYEFIKKEIDKRTNMGNNNVEADDFQQMMCFLFAWSDTPQGHAYWHSVVTREVKMKEDLQNHSHE
jgi:hypothetical protein